MAIGERYFSNIKSWRDKEFGYNIIQPIEQDGNRTIYFTSNCFTNKNDELVVACIRGGRENFYLLNFTTGEYLQLTDESGLAISKAYFDKQRDNLYFCSKRFIKCVNIRTLEIKEIYESENDLGSMSVTCDGSYLISSYKFPFSHINNDQNTVGYTLDRIFRICLKTGKREIILQRSFTVDHIQCSPVNPEEILYCAWGYMCTHHRIWGANLNGTKGGSLGPEQPNEHRTHEYFTPDGKHIAYHGKFSRFDEDSNRFVNIGHTWGMMNADGSNDRYYQCPEGMQAGHSIMSYNGKMVTADGNGFISLLEFDDVKMKVYFKHIFAHRSSMKNNFVHPHPSFSNDDRYILFATDFGMDKTGNVYLLDIQSKSL